MYLCIMKLKYKTLYDPKQKCFIHATHAFGEPQVFTSTTPQLLVGTVSKTQLEFVVHPSSLDGYELIDVEISGEFEIE